jgi:DNA gyrase subunit A
MSRGIIALTLDEGDELIAAKLTDGTNEIFLGSWKGQAIRFSEDQVRSMGRPARGVRAMALAKDDYLVGMEVVDEGALILSISEKGYGKRTALRHYRLQSRGGKGVINMKTTARTGNVLTILSVKEDSDVMIITKDGKMIRLEAGQIRQVGRSSQGVRLVTLEEDDRVAAASVVPEGNGDGPNGKNGSDSQGTLPLQ